MTPRAPITVLGMLLLILPVSAGLAFADDPESDEEDGSVQGKDEKPGSRSTSKERLTPRMTPRTVLQPAPTSASRTPSKGAPLPSPTR